MTQNLTTKHPSPAISFGATFFIVLGALAVGLFAISPLVEKSAGLVVANIFYVALPVVAMLGLSFLATWHYEKNTYMALSFTGLLMFLDKVVMLSGYYAWQYHLNPASFEQTYGATLFTIAFNNALSYIIFIPAILLLAFVGSFFGSYLKRRQSQGKTPPASN